MPNKLTSKQFSDFRNIPAELTTPAEWIPWYSKKEPGKKPGKAPITAYADPADHAANCHPLDYWLKKGNTREGFSRVLNKAEGFIVIDLDHARDVKTGVIEPWARSIINDFDTYTELSYSGSGFHLVCRGGPLYRDWNPKGTRIEIYSGNIPNKLMSFTGDVFEQRAVINDRQSQAEDLLDRMQGEAGAAPDEVIELGSPVPDSDSPPDPDKPWLFEDPCKGKKPRYVLISYPFWAWEGTPYADFAKQCREGNNIPLRFFTEILKTVVGAICGHRLQIQGNRMDARFYTVILSDRGGVGKSTGLEWTVQNLFGGTGLCHRGNSSFVNIGCFYGGFGSGVGLRKRFEKQPRILQYYDELASMVEKFGIKGSGQDYLAVQNALYDSNVWPSNDVKDTNVEDVPPDCVWNSILGCSIQEKWEEMFAATSAVNSGFFQRLNIVAGERIKVVSILNDPELTDVREALLKKILPLENAVLTLELTIDARLMLDAWYGEFRERTGEEPSDVTGRINVLALRNAMHIAWLLDVQDPEQPHTVQITGEAMQRALALAEYGWLTRREYKPLPGKNDTAKIEAHIGRVMAKESQMIRSVLYRRINGHNYGRTLFQTALENLKRDGNMRAEERQAAKQGRGSGGRNAEVLQWLG